MKPAVRQALAYVAVTGEFPKHIRLDTWSAVYDLVTSDGRGGYTVDNPALIADHPTVQAHRFLTGRGFTVRRQRSTSHYITYDHPDGDKATSYRSGGLSITYYSQPKPYRTEHITADEINSVNSHLVG